MKILFKVFVKICLPYLWILLLQFDKQYTYAEGTTNRVTDCIEGPSTAYNGTQAFSAAGSPCLQWDQIASSTNESLPFDGGQHSYCRNPTGDFEGTWCYTSAEPPTKQYCNIPKCSDASVVAITCEFIYNSTLVAFPADFEVQTQAKNIANAETLVSSNGANNYFHGLTADHSKKLLFFGKYRSIGIYNLKTNKTIKVVLDRMLVDMASLAYDWSTQNLYWTDRYFEWIAATDETFQYHTLVYQSEDGDIPDYLALHVTQRLMFFSTYKQHHVYKIIKADLSGQSREVLFHSPNISRVGGLSIDYSDDRLYWSENNLVVGTEVFSCRIDGSDNRMIFESTNHNLILKNIAIYSDYLYILDAQSSKMSKELQHWIWVIRKSTRNTKKYSIFGKPTGIVVLDKNGKSQSYKKMSSTSLENPCLSQPCQQMCFPLSYKKRKCVCSIGYFKSGETDCIPKWLKSKYLILADPNQGKVFQVSLNSNRSSSDFSVVPLPTDNKISSVALNTQSKFAYWSDTENGIMFRSNLNGSGWMELSREYHAKSLKVNPVSGNVYFVDDDYQTINVMSGDGKYVKAIMTSQSNLTRGMRSRAIGIDARNRKIYWTQTNETTSKGQFCRMDLAGSEPRVMIEGLNWPGPIVVSYKRKSVFVAEERSFKVIELSLQSDMKPYSPFYQLTHKNQSYLYDFTVFEDSLYYFPSERNKLQKFDLSSHKTTDLMESAFFSVYSVTFYDQDFNKQYFDSIKSPCHDLQNSCHLCIDLSDSKYYCLDEGYISPSGGNGAGNWVGKFEKHTNLPPNYGNTCPNDATIQLPECQSLVEYSMPPLTWKDDNTDAKDLILINPSSPIVVAAGIHNYTFKAVDKAGLIGVCNFRITVSERRCSKPPELPSCMKSSQPVCGSQFGSSYLVYCKDRKKYLKYDNFTFTNTSNKCNELGKWEIENFDNFTCVRKGDSSNTFSMTVNVTVIILVCITVFLIIFLLLLIIRKKEFLKQSSFSFIFSWTRKLENPSTNLIMDSA